MKTIKEIYEAPFKHHGYHMLFDKNSHHILDCDNDVLMSVITRKLNELPIPVELDIKVNLPVSYIPTKIIDANGEEIVSIRGWGWLQKKENGAEIQDKIGAEIAEIINSFATHMFLYKLYGTPKIINIYTISDIGEKAFYTSTGND